MSNKNVTPRFDYEDDIPSDNINNNNPISEFDVPNKVDGQYVAKNQKEGKTALRIMMLQRKLKIGTTNTKRERLANIENILNIAQREPVARAA